MKRLYIQNSHTLINLDYSTYIRIEPEYVRPESGGFRDIQTRQPTDFFVVHADNAAIFRSRIEAKCQEFMMRLGNTICRSPSDALIISLANGKFVYRSEENDIITVPDEQFLCEVEHIITCSEQNDTLCEP